MPGYRFCRTDDVGALAHAYNDCLASQIPGLPPLEPEVLKRRGRLVDFWASSSMLAFDERGPIGVLLAAKRAAETCILALGVHREQRRRGHARHLLESLARKLAILGPPRLTMEIDSRDQATRALLTACGFGATGTLVDLVLDGDAMRAEEGHLPELAAPVGFDELSRTCSMGSRESWMRAPEALARRAPQLQALAIHSDRVEAFCLYETSVSGEEISIAALGAPGDSAAVTPLLATLASLGARWLRIPRLGRDELPIETLTGIGFRVTREWTRFSLDVSAG